LGDNSTTKIVRRGRVRLTLQDGRKRTLPGVLHISGFAGNLIYVSNMSDAGMHTLFHKESCKMVRGVMVLMRGVRIGTLYKMLGNVDLTGCNNIITPEIDSTTTRLDSMSTQLDSTRAKSVQIDSTRHDELNLTRAKSIQIDSTRHDELDLTRSKSVQIDSTRHDELNSTKLWHKRM
jgi:hypothetical protein